MSETITVASLRERILRAVDDSITKLARAASGEQAIRYDCELRACIVLARLAPILVAEATRAKSKATQSEETRWQELPPDLSLAESERLLAIIEADGLPTDKTAKTNN